MLGSLTSCPQGKGFDFYKVGVLTWSQAYLGLSRSFNNYSDVGICLVAGISFRQFYQKIFKNFVFRTRMKFIIDNPSSIKFGIFIFRFMNSNQNILWNIILSLESERKDLSNDINRFLLLTRLLFLRRLRLLRA